MNQELKGVVECTQPWYVRLKQEKSVQYNRVVLWGLYQSDATGERFRYVSPMIVMDGVPTEATTFKNFDGTEYCDNWTSEIMELPE